MTACNQDFTPEECDVYRNEYHESVFTPELPCLYTQADNKMKLKLNKSGRVVYPRCFPSM